MAKTRSTRSARAGDGDPTSPALLDATTDADLVRVPVRKAVCIDGEGDPGDASFQRCVGALYGVAYTLKFARKGTRRPDFKIGALEGRWTAVGQAAPGAIPPRGAWRWRLRLAMPADVTAREVAEAIHAAVSRKSGKLEGSREAARVTLERIAAKRFGRVLHVGPYADEPRSVERIRAMLAEANAEPEHGHLEIYLSDPGRTAPARLRTVLLLPVARAGERRSRRAS